jgi:beta-glucosidase
MTLEEKVGQLMLWDARGQAAVVSVDVENTGQRAGDEIVQVYVSDVVTSATWVNKALMGFARLHLAPGEKKTAHFELPWEAFQIVDAEGRSVVEAGEFEILVGPSSRDHDLLKAVLRVV